MEEGDITSLITADDVSVLQEECLSRPSTCTTYETFETFMQSLAPSMELPSNGDDASNFCVTDSLVSRAEEIDSLATAETISTPEEEVKRLKDLVALLQIRLDATSRVVEIQENELCREMEGDEETRSNYEKLLNRWRREVCILLLKQRVDALQGEQRRLMHTQKEQRLTVQLQEARALVEVLKQKDRNLQAEIGILTTGQKLAEMTMRAEAARRQHEMEGTVKGVTRAAVEALSCFVDQHSAIMFHQLEQLGDACCSGWLQVGPLWTTSKIQQAANNDGRKYSDTRRKIFRKVEDSVNTERPRSMERKGDRPPVSPKPPRSANDHSGRTSQLEVILAVTKTQLSEECMHSRELQERLGKIELDGKDAMKKAVRRAHDQAERDLVAIKRQHSQFIKSLENRISKLQNEHAKSIVAYHQLERKLLQQQQEFVHTLNQRDNEFRKSLDAKEIEVNGLLDEQNALLNKLKKFWRPILNSSAAKIFTEKTQRTSSTSTRAPSSSQESKPQEDKSHVQTPRSSQTCKNMDCNSEVSDKTPASVRSMESQTVMVWRSEKKKKTTTRDYTSESEQENKKERKDIRAQRPNTTGSQNLSRALSMGRKIKPDPKVKKNEDNLISSYLSRLQKSYVSTNKQQSQFKSNLNTRGLDALLEKAGHSQTPSSVFLPDQQEHLDEGGSQAEARPVSRLSSAFTDSHTTNEESLPQYIICVSPRKTTVRNPIYSPRKRQTSETSTSALQEKLENLEALSETLLGQRM